MGTETCRENCGCRTPSDVNFLHIKEYRRQVLIVQLTTRHTFGFLLKFRVITNITCKFKDSSCCLSLSVSLRQNTYFLQRPAYIWFPLVCTELWFFLSSLYRDKGKVFDAFPNFISTRSTINNSYNPLHAVFAYRAEKKNLLFSIRGDSCSEMGSEVYIKMLDQLLTLFLRG